MKKRNPDANCGNCPYSQEIMGSDQTKRLFCCLSKPDTWRVIDPYNYCGEHPDFFPPEPIPETPGD